ncbi:trans-aconitate 3-methyltransferase, partial [Tremellales sp. Uapishka_1]
MSTFARATFDVARYLACRPTYPQAVYDTILAHHRSNGGQFDRAVDLGCGPGFMALNLAPAFRHTTGIDPSSKMIDIGLQPTDPSVPRITYKVGGAETLSQTVGPEGADLVVAGQAAHWFDYPKVWNELTKLVNAGGTVAFVGYAEALFTQYPDLTPLITHHSASKDALGPYWSQPGRSIVENLLDAVPFPLDHTSDFKPIPNPRLGEWDPASALRIKTLHGERWLMTKTFSLSSLEGYFRTWSSLHSYLEKHPDSDIIETLMEKIQAGIPEGKKDEIELGWPLVLMMIKKKETHTSS